MKQPEPLLSVSGLNYKYEERQAVCDLSFSVGQGEIFGLLGPNGAGKTTSISCITGLLSDWEGTMTFADASFDASRSIEDRRSLGLVPQELAIYENLSATENLTFFAKLSGVPAAHIPQAVDRQMQLSGLTDRAKDLVRTFSGGMKRRLNLAVGLLHDPQLIVLDEPTVGVDPQSRNHLFESLLELKQNGRSLLYTTHYMEEAQRLCDRVAIMDHGKILDLDTVDGLLARHGGKAVVTATIATDSERDGFDDIDRNGQVRFEADDPIDRLQELKSEGYVFDSIQIASAGLESVFLKLTGRELRDSDRL